MRASKAMSGFFAAGLPANPWRVEPRAEARKPAEPWSFLRLFARKPPSLYQRCLAVHIYHASQQKSLH